MRRLVLILMLLGPPLAPAQGEAQFEHLVLVQLNRVRADPPKYAEYLASLRPRYQKDKIVLRPGEASARTQEGIAALEDAIHALRSAPSVLQLAGCEPLDEAAREYAAEQSRTGAVGHGNLARRISHHGTWLEAIGENISYGSTTPERVVADLIIDDGNPLRGHRANILNNSFRVAGVGVNRHPTYGVVCVIDFAGGFTAR